jgi:hypothetical protein
MKRVVIGLVDTPKHADVALRRLAAFGVPPQRISVLYPDRKGEHDFAFVAATKAPEGALVGAGFGGILGAMTGLAFGLAGVIPAAAMLVQTGPLLIALSGAAIGALVLGIVGAVIGAAMPEIEVRHYDGKVVADTILVGIHTTSSRETRHARTILRSVAASDVHAMGEAPLPLSST